MPKILVCVRHGHELVTEIRCVECARELGWSFATDQPEAWCDQCAKDREAVAEESS